MENGKIHMAEIHKEIDLIQACITRMASNSFMIKGWAYGIIAVLAGFLVNAKVEIYIVCLIAIFCRFHQLLNWKSAISII